VGDFPLKSVKGLKLEKGPETRPFFDFFILPVGLADLWSKLKGLFMMRQQLNLKHFLRWSQDFDPGGPERFAMKVGTGANALTLYFSIKLIAAAGVHLVKGKA
jgi:hypothetical protein